MSQIIFGKCEEELSNIPDASIDCVITDPPYPCIDRDYGRMEENEWMTMMQKVVKETRRVLKPHGSAMFVLQPNSESVGRMRPWLWDFMSWCCREWNMVQDAWWWNHVTLPTSGAAQHGLMRGSLKACVWLGAPDCYRSQKDVLWSESQDMTAQRLSERFDHAKGPSGHTVNRKRILDVAEKRGGVTPFNVFPCANTTSSGKFSSHGHGARTPEKLVDWWIRYICPTDGVVGDWFTGVGTIPLVAKSLSRDYVAIEAHKPYYDVLQERLK